MLSFLIALLYYNTVIQNMDTMKKEERFHKAQKSTLCCNLWCHVNCWKRKLWYWNDFYSNGIYIWSHAMQHPAIRVDLNCTCKYKYMFVNCWKLKYDMWFIFIKMIYKAMWCIHDQTWSFCKCADTATIMCWCCCCLKTILLRICCILYRLTRQNQLESNNVS